MALDYNLSLQYLTEEEVTADRSGLYAWFE